MPRNHKKQMSNARRDRREKARLINKKYEFIRFLDIDDEYTKIVLGLSEMTQERKKTFLEYIRVRMPLDKKFKDHMLELNHSIAVETKKRMESEKSKEQITEEVKVNESTDNS